MTFIIWHWVMANAHIHTQYTVGPSRSPDHPQLQKEMWINTLTLAMVRLVSSPLLSIDSVLYMSLQQYRATRQIRGCQRSDWTDRLVKGLNLPTESPKDEITKIEWTLVGDCSEIECDFCCTADVAKLTSFSICGPSQPEFPACSPPHPGPPHPGPSWSLRRGGRT